MLLSNNPKTSDLLGRYYTNSIVGAVLVDAMGISNPSLAIDICAGEGDLVLEAAKAWKRTRFITADIEENSSRILLQKLNGRVTSHYIGDALDINLAEQIGFRWGQADAALCNPPYINPIWKKQFSEILEDAGMSHVISRMRSVPADLLFIAQNLRLLRQGGRLGLILPDGIVAGERFAKFRKTLLHKHRVERIIELPRGIFKKTEAKAHIIVLSKDEGGSEFIAIQQLGKNGLLSPQCNVPTSYAIKRLDYTYNAQRNIKSCKKIGDVVMDVLRGSISSSERFHLDYPVFHTSDFSENCRIVPDKYTLPNDIQEIGIKTIAVRGDILVARVGRNLNRKVCKVSSDRVAISDCILLLRVLPEHRDAVFTHLQSNEGRQALDAVSHGVGAKFITVQSLLEIPF